MSFYKDKRVAVTGANGMIGRELTDLLSKEGSIVSSIDLNTGFDLTNYDSCLQACSNQDYVFHLAGVKGNPRMTAERPLDFMYPMLKFDRNMIEAAQSCGVERFLYTSSIAVLNPETDKFPAWAKRTGEMLCEANRAQYPTGTKFCIVRPANVYGKYDNFNNPNAMVITSLIAKAGKNSVFEVWGDGTEVRDFIYSKDVARGMMLALEKMVEEPINLCSGVANTIRDVATAIKKYTNSTPMYTAMKKTGDARRVMPTNGQLIGFEAETDLETGIKEVIEWREKTI